MKRAITGMALILALVFTATAWSQEPPMERGKMGKGKMGKGKMGMGKMGMGESSQIENTALAENQDVVVATAHTPPLNDGLPMPGFKITRGTTALMVTDPQNDFLSPEGSAWGVVGKSVTENGTVENLGALFKVADENDRDRAHRKKSP